MRAGLLRPLWLVARREYVRTVRRKGFVFGTVLLPLGLVGLVVLSSAVGGSGLGSPAGGGVATGPVDLVLVNESRLRIAASSGTETAHPGAVRLSTRDEAMGRVRAGEIGEFYVVPEDYVPRGHVERWVGETQGLDLGSLERRAAQEAHLADVLREALLGAESLSAETADRILDPVQVSQTALDGSAPPAGMGDIAGFLFPYAFSLLFVFSIFITSGYLLQSVTEEKENRVVEIVLSSIPALPLMAGKILGLGAAGLTQVLIWLLSVLLVLPVVGLLSAVQIGPVTVVLTLAYFILGYICYGAIFAAVGSLAPGTREAQQYAGFLGIFAVIPLMLTTVFLTDIDSPVVTALALFPLTAPASVLQILAVSGADIPWLLIGVSLIVLAVSTALIVVGSARLFRATVLLYGVRPSVRQIGRALLARP
ncbi:ABC transporter permease [soil metagenome]